LTLRRFDRSLPMALLRARESIMGFFRPLLNAYGLTEQQWRIIRVLHEHDDMEFHQLAKLACILPPSLTGILMRLEKLQLTRRRKVAGDQRRLHVSLTAQGKEKFVVISRHMEPLYRDIETQFGERRLASLFRLLDAARELLPSRAELKACRFAFASSAAPTGSRRRRAIWSMNSDSTVSMSPSGRTLAKA